MAKAFSAEELADLRLKEYIATKGIRDVVTKLQKERDDLRKELQILRSRAGKMFHLKLFGPNFNKLIKFCYFSAHT